MSEAILEIKNFSKCFRSHWTFRPIQAVQDVSLTVYRGESFGFLGHNGAGKTTTIKSIVGLILKSQGEILIDGCDSTDPEQRKKFGYLPEHPYFYDHLTVEETLDFYAALHEIPKHIRRKKVAETLERVHIEDRKKASVRSLSKGLQQRLGFATAIINEPKLLLLDEPFSGLDPIGRMEIRQLVLDLKREGTTIFLSSHILSDVENICDRVSIMAKGELKKVFNLKETPELFGESYELTLRHPKKTDAEINSLATSASEVDVEDTIGGYFHRLRFSDYESGAKALEKAAASALQVERFERKGHSLEEIFMDITGNKLPQQDAA